MRQGQGLCLCFKSLVPILPANKQALGQVSLAGGESVNNICTALPGFHPPLAAPHQGSEGGSRTPSLLAGAPFSPPGQELRSAGLTKSGWDPLSAGSHRLPNKGALPPTLRESPVGAQVAASQCGTVTAVPPRAVGCGGLEWQRHQSLGNSCYVKRSEGEFTVSVNNR